MMVLLHEGDCESCHHDAHHRHQLDEDIERRTGCILEWVAHGVANDTSLMGKRALASEGTFLDVLLGIVPGTACVGHEHSQCEATCQTTNQQS